MTEADVSVPQPRAPGPSPWIIRFLTGLKTGADVLDIACGSGRHLRLLHARGHSVTGIDRSLDGIRDMSGLPGVTLIEADLEAGGAFPMSDTRFGGVVVTNYLHRPLLTAMVAAVADDGLLLYETFALGQETLGRPSNPDFLLRPNELIDAARPRLTVVAYEHGRIDDDRPRIVQRIAAVGARHPWAATGVAEFSTPSRASVGRSEPAPSVEVALRLRVRRGPTPAMA